MTNYSTVDREFLQTLLESAFTVQHSHMDSQSLSAIVEAERLITSGELEHVLNHIVEHARPATNARSAAIPLLRGEEMVGRATMAESAPEPGVPLNANSGLSTPPPGEEPRTAAESMDADFPSFRVRPPEVEAAQFPSRDPWVPWLVNVVIAVVLLLLWMLGRVAWRGTADRQAPAGAGSVSQAVKARPTLRVTATPDPAQSGENRRADPSPKPPIHAKTRSPETPSDTLVIYQGRKVIFPLKASANVGPSSPKSGETNPDPSRAPGEPLATDPVPGSPGKANARLLQQVEPEYPEAARQQHIQGRVVLEAQVGKDGAVQQLSVISGNSMLTTAASDAVRQWRFVPFVQNGHAVQFQTRIKVHFVLP
ncbi:MAG: TonB family protein [Candidatus Sulfotelmatobacter sp.]